MDLHLGRPPCWPVKVAYWHSGLIDFKVSLYMSVFTVFMSLTDDSLRTAHFSMGAQSASSMPVLIRSNTTSLLDRASTLDQRDHRTSNLEQRDHRPNTLDYRTVNMDHRNNIMDHRTSTLDQRDHRTSTLDQRDHRTSTLEQRDHRTSTLDQRSKTMDRGCGMKEGQSRKLSM